MLLFSSFLCVMLVPPCSTTSDEYVEIVDAAVKELTIASTDSEDVLSTLNSFGSQAISLMKAVMPIAAIVVETINSKEQSKEYNALIDFKNRTDGILRDYQTRVNNFSRATGHISFVDYTIKVDHLLKNMKTMTADYLNPKIQKTDAFILNFKEACEISNKISPEAILIFLNKRLVVNCGDAISRTDARKLADYRASFKQLLLQLNVEQEHNPDPGLFLSEFMDIYKRIDERVLIEDLDVYHRYFSSTEKAVQELFTELLNRSLFRKVLNRGMLCNLGTLIKKSFFNYPVIKAFVTKLKNQLVDVSFHAGICAAVLYHTNPSQMNSYTKEVADNVMRISSFTSKFLNDSLISAWPSAHNQILDEQIKRVLLQSGYVDNRNFGVVAGLAEPLLANTGIPNYVYDIVFVKADENEYEHYFEGMNNYCSFKKRQSGYDTVIGRIPLDTTSRRKTCPKDGEMLRKSIGAAEMNITIQYEMDKQYNAANLPLIAKTLKKKIGIEFITEEKYHCWGIVRKWSAPFISYPTIDFWSSSQTHGGSNEKQNIINLSYENSGWATGDCESFRFYFFL